MAGKDIIFFGGLDWSDRRKLSSHHIAERLARTNRVFYIDNFGGIRDVTLKDIPRALRKLKTVLQRQGNSRPDVKGDHSGIEVYQPLIVPTPRLPTIIGKLNIALLSRGLKRLVSRYQIRDPVIWTRVPTDIVWHSIIGLRYRVLVYQSVDRFPYSPMIGKFVRSRLARYEKMFCESADVVFASARGLYEEKIKINPHTYFFPNGVDPELFRRPTNHVECLERIKRPIIGFAGALGPWVDYGLVQQVALQTREWSYVFLGPINPGTDLKGLDRLSNVHLMGVVHHVELPAWFKYFDIGLIPYLMNDFTKHTFPSKMAEYLAAGLPVISTPLPEIEPYSDVVKTVRSPQEMIEAIWQELNSPDQELLRKKRFNVVSALSWQSIVSQMEELIDQTFNEAKGRSHHHH